jgi:hypothetical protein
MSFEARVWCENGDLLGFAEVVPERDGWSVSVNGCDESSGYCWPDTPFQWEQEAVDYAKEWAQGYWEYWQERCDCGTSDCGVLEPHGISIQFVRDN